MSHSGASERFNSSWLISLSFSSRAITRLVFDLVFGGIIYTLGHTCLMHTQCCYVEHQSLSNSFGSAL